MLSGAFKRQPFAISFQRAPNLSLAFGQRAQRGGYHHAEVEGSVAVPGEVCGGGFHPGHLLMPHVDVTTRCHTCRKRQAQTAQSPGVRGSALVMVGRGNLNQTFIYLKVKGKFRLTISVEYYLEYQATGFEPRIPIC